MIVVLDTNVLVSGLMISANPPGRIVDLVREGKLRLAIDDRIFAEYENVPARPYFRTYFTLEETARVIASSKWIQCVLSALNKFQTCLTKRIRRLQKPR